MLAQSHQGDHLRKLHRDVRRAHNVTSALMADVLATMDERGSASPRLAPARRLHALVEAGAWTDAALALLDLKLPRWTLRRLVYEDGEWRCYLGKQWPLPEWLDDTVEAGHPVLPLAILDALIEARALVQASASDAPRSVPSIRLPRDVAYLCCDNFC
jgi:hypothetical protein